MSSIFYKASLLLLGLALILAVATWWNARQQLLVVTEANTFVRKTLGDMMVAITEKDREIDRLAKSPCNTSENSHLRRGRERQ
jgi:hypothetical protein